MKSFGVGKYALSGGVAAALLAGCGGSQPPIGAPGALDPLGKKHSQTFTYTGAEQTFMVPKGVIAVTVTASGASGSSTFARSGPSALGGLVMATIPVTPGETLAVFVGGAGTPEGSGYNGGGANGNSGTCSGSGCGGGGGGASDVRQGGDSLKNRVVVAGGGGGEACCNNAPQGGAGGGLHGAAGANGPNRRGFFGGKGGKGGSQNQGGRGGKGGRGYTGCPGTKGDNGVFGDGGQGGTTCEDVPGGGGGGGYYGGGGGGGGCGICGRSSYFTFGGGGGGGSSYVEKGATGVRDTRGAAAPGNGQVVISWHSG